MEIKMEKSFYNNLYKDLAEIARRKYVEYLSNPCDETWDAFTAADLEAANHSEISETIINL